MSRIASFITGLFAATFVATVAIAQTQGISKSEIVIGTIQDLSGPIAAYGKQARNGIQMRVDEINAKGGINGRKFKLMVEDNGYDPKKALLAAQKLVTNDEVFAILGAYGDGREYGGNADSIREKRDQLFPVNGFARNVRATGKIKDGIFTAVFRSDAHCHAAHGEREIREKSRVSIIRTTNLASRFCAARKPDLKCPR